MYLLDTNHCTAIILNNQNIIQELSDRNDEGAALSVIVEGELLFMVENSEQRDRNRILFNAFLQQFDIYPINHDIAAVYGTLKASIIRTFAPRDKAKRRKTKIQDIGFDDNDLWVAATAIHYGLTLVSSDRDFQRIQQVSSFTVESWL